MTTHPPPSSARITRAADGRWLGGVCAGLAASRVAGGRLSPLWPRLGFVALTALGGIGLVLYLACWLILPGPARDDGAPGPRGLVIVAKAVASIVGLLVLAGLGAAATVFGFGWWVLAAAAIALVAALGVRRLGPAWALLPVLALTGPSVALAVGGVHLLPRDGQTVVHVRSIGALERRPYRSGLDTLLIDMRRTPLPAHGRSTVHIRAGVRRTIVALPADRCVHVIVHQHINGLATQVGALLAGRSDSAYASVFAFGRLYSSSLDGPVDRRAPGRGPTLVVDFRSMGGSLYVRDYPRRLDPNVFPDWPGYPVFAEPRPETRGLGRATVRRMLESWRSRQQAQRAQQERYAARVPGPCGRR